MSSKGARSCRFSEAAELSNSILSSLKSLTHSSVVSLAFLGESTPHLSILPPTSKFVQPLCSWLLYVTHVLPRFDPSCCFAIKYCCLGISLGRIFSALRRTIIQID